MNSAPRPKHYKVIYADPPWKFSTYSRKGKGRSAEAYYDCMRLADIKRCRSPNGRRTTACYSCGRRIRCSNGPSK